MNDEQRRVALFQVQPEGLGLFFRPAALAFAHVESLHIAHAALLDEKIVPAGPIGLVLTGPNTQLTSSLSTSWVNRSSAPRFCSTNSLPAS
ncbi:MAG: hypothetical protein AB2784_13640, partial [Candidatus Thiodiazotropha endolucinida]